MLRYSAHRARCALIFAPPGWRSGRGLIVISVALPPLGRHRIEGEQMRYALLMHYREPAQGEISEEALAEAMEAFGAYGRALEEAGVLRSGDVLQPTAATTTVTRRDGSLRVQDGPFAETKEALAGVFVLDVPDLDAAIGWAEKCPGAQWGVLEVRPVATALIGGQWTH
jgi:hypothetical protein